MKVAVTHVYSDSNKGDLAIVEATIGAVKKRYPNADIMAFSMLREDSPEFAHHTRWLTRSGLDIRQGLLASPYRSGTRKSRYADVAAAYTTVMDRARLFVAEHLSRTAGSSDHDAREALRLLKSCDAIFVKGGSYIYNDQGRLRGAIYLWRTLASIRALIRTGAPVILLGHTLGPFDRHASEKRALSTLSRCHAVVVRDRRSYEMAQTAGLENVVLAPDVAVLTQPRKPESVPDFVEAGDRSWLGVTAVNPAFIRAQPKTDAESSLDYEEMMIQGLTKIGQTLGLGVALFPQVTSSEYGANDLTTLERFRAALGENGIATELVDGDYSPSEMAWLYGRCELVVGTRLHSCLLSMCGGTAAIALSYHGWKTEGVMDVLGLQDFVLPAVGLSPDVLVETATRMTQNRATVERKIEAAVARARDELDHVLDDIFARTMRRAS